MEVSLKNPVYGWYEDTVLGLNPLYFIWAGGRLISCGYILPSVVLHAPKLYLKIDFQNTKFPLLQTYR